MLQKNTPICGMTVKAAGSMRFRWNETNPHRDEFLGKLSDEIREKGTGDFSSLKVTPVELIHSQTVYDVKQPGETYKLTGDGIITKNTSLMPVVTVADCMPAYLYDPVTEVFGVVHSGWKGTGIIAKAIELAEKNYGTKPEDCCVILGPHIESCCYIVNEERADYFRKTFTPECVTELEEGGSCYAGGRGLAVDWNNGGGRLFRLSLGKANLAVLRECGVREDNINVIKECTCCNEKFGSNRRETAESGTFTVQAAFICRQEDF